MEEFDGAIGIDLGTTFSCVGVLLNDKIEIIPNDQGSRTVPSYVAFTPTERLIGDAAKNQGPMNPENTIFDAKRLIGRKMSDKAVQSDMKNWPFKVIDQDDKPFIKASYLGEDKVFAPEQISSMVLLKMKEIAEAFLGKTVKNAVVTVPAYFNDSQRQATKDAGAIAGLNVLRIINEPTAAAIAYGLESQGGEGERVVLIFDLGGGTFDVSLLTLEKGVFTVKATAGDTHLGGEDFDNRLVDHLKEIILKKHQKDISGSARAIRRLRNACEKAKRVLSTQTSAAIDVDSLIDGIDFSHTISRAKFEDLCSDLFIGCLAPVERVLKDSGISKERVDDIVLVGGSTRIPKVQSILSDFFGGKALNKSINPDEAVAYGAAVQASILCGKKMKATQDLLLLDVVPLSLGIEMQGGVMAVVVPRNTSIPCRKTSMFTTTEHSQTTVEFPVYEGERPLTKDNNLLGAFSLTGILPLPKGKPELECVFNIDANGILSVSASDKLTGRKADIVIQNGQGRLSAAEIERMVKEAQQFESEDKMKRECIAAKDEFSSYLFQMQETISDPSLAKKLDVGRIENILAEGLEFLDLNPDAEKSKLVAQKRIVEKKVNELFAKLYK